MNKKIVIVSGGCGGIGRYVTQGLLSDGLKVILVGRNEKNYHDVFKGQVDLESLEFYSADVSSLSEVKKFYEDNKSKFQRPVAYHTRHILAPPATLPLHRAGH